MTIASSPHWALISDKGTTVAPFDSMLSIDVKNESKLLTSPVEESVTIRLQARWTSTSNSPRPLPSQATRRCWRRSTSWRPARISYPSSRPTRNTASSTSRAIASSALQQKARRCLSRNCICSKSGRSKYEYHKPRYEARNARRRRRRLIGGRYKRKSVIL